MRITNNQTLGEINLGDDNTKPLSRAIRIDEGEIRGHLDKLVRGTVEETLNALLDAEADEICRACQRTKIFDPPCGQYS